MAGQNYHDEQRSTDMGIRIENNQPIGEEYFETDMKIQDLNPALDLIIDVS